MDEVRLVCQLDGTAPFSRGCSAIAQSRTTRVLEITFERPDDDKDRAMGEHLWEAIAYALFSKDSRSSISSVTLSSASLTTDEIDAIEQVLRSNDPTSLVFGRRNGLPEPTEPTGDLNFGMAKQGTFVTLLNEDVSELATCILEADIGGVKIVNTGGNEADSYNVRAVVPGYGLCRVARDGFIVTTDQCQAFRITSLTLWQLSVDSNQTLIRFLELVGPSLDRLDINVSVPFPQLFRACSSVKTLKINGRFDVESFIETCERSQASVTCLNARPNNSKNLAKALANTTTRLAKTLKQLTCSFNTMEDITAMSDMLEANRTLECFEVSNMTSNEELERYHNMSLPIAREPFPIECRLAFLSIFTAGQKQCARTAQKKTKPNGFSPAASSVASSKVIAYFPVDRNVQCIIFSFAAECVRRRITAQTPRSPFLH